MDGSTVEEPVGGMFCIWGDHPFGESEQEVAANARLVLRAMALRMDGKSLDGMDTGVVTGGFNADGTINGSTVVEKADKTELAAAIAEAEALNADEYTAETWNAVAEALAAARTVYADDDAKQDAVDAAAEALNDAIIALEYKPVYSITIDTMTGGTVTADKGSYDVGDTVTLTVTPAEGYSQKLYINGEPVMLDWKTNAYSFVATETSYTVTGSFVPGLDHFPCSIFHHREDGPHHASGTDAQQHQQQKTVRFEKASLQYDPSLLSSVHLMHREKAV